MVARGLGANISPAPFVQLECLEQVVGLLEEETRNVKFLAERTFVATKTVDIKNAAGVVRISI